MSEHDSTGKDQTSQETPRRVEAPAARDPAIRLIIAGVMLVGMGVWCFMDRHRYDPPPGWDFEHINEAAKYAFNAFGAYVFVPPGVVLLIWAGVFLRRKMIADQEGIGYDGKQKVAWKQISEIDATQLKSKGIMKLHYGQNKILTLDSWKLTNFRDLVSLVESNVPADKMKT